MKSKIKFLILLIFICMAGMVGTVSFVNVAPLKSMDRPHYIPEKDNGVCYEYYQKSGGEWYVDGNTYKNRVVLKGRTPVAACDSEFVVLTNDESISFEEVSKSIYSNNSKDWLEPQKAVIVEIR